MTDLRDAIARAIFLVDYAVIGEESWETSELDGNDDRRQAFEKADAVLAVLRDLPDDVIGEAAEGGVVERFARDVEVLRAENHLLHRIVEIQDGRLAEQQIEQGG